MSTTQTVNVSAVIDGSLGPLQRNVVILCGLAAMLDGFDVQCIAFVVPVVAAQWNIPPSSFGIVFAAGLLGLCIGAAILGPFADRYGRRRAIVGALVSFGLCSLMTATSSSLYELMGWRFVTGFGLGGLLPNVFALTAEYAPKRIRTTIITLMFCGFPAGAVLGGAISAKVIPLFGWKVVFLAGGILPLVLSMLLLFALPESLYFLVSHSRNPELIVSILRRLRPGLELNVADSFVTSEGQASTASIRELFADGTRAITLTLWILFFFTLLTLYFLVNWLPVVLRQAGLPLETAIFGTTLLNFGGIAGGLLMARLVDRYGIYNVLFPGYVGSSLGVAAVGLWSDGATSALALAFFAGFFVIGCSFVIAAWASDVYPTTLRSTGVGCSLAVGRIGSIVGPIAGGVLLAGLWTTSQILAIAALPSLLCAAAIAVFWLFSRKRNELVEAKSDA